MHRDTEEALQRLEQELLAEDPEETVEDPEIEEEDYGEVLEEPGSEETVVYRNFSNNYGADLRNYATGYKAYNSDTLDTDLEDFSHQVREGQKETVHWLPIAIALLASAAVVYIGIVLGGLL